jgi:hypothetical protein
MARSRATCHPMYRCLVHHDLGYPAGNGREDQDLRAKVTLAGQSRRCCRPGLRLPVKHDGVTSAARVPSNRRLALRMGDRCHGKSKMLQSGRRYCSMGNCCSPLTAPLGSVGELWELGSWEVDCRKFFQGLDPLRAPRVAN